METALHKRGSQTGQGAAGEHDDENHSGVHPMNDRVGRAIVEWAVICAALSKDWSKNTIIHPEITS